MQQIEQQGKQGQQPVIEQPISQPVAKPAANDKEQVGEDGAEAVYMVFIGQPQGSLGQQQRQLKGHAIDPVVIKARHHIVGLAQDIIQVGCGGKPLAPLINVNAVIAGKNQAGQQEKGADD